MIKRTVKGWIPFWGDKWLFGSMRIEFNVTERGIWWDLMALAMKDDGYIRANEDTPYLSQQLAGMLIIPEDLLIKTIDKFVAANKYIRLKNGTLKIANWDKYCFTDRHMRRVQEQEMSAEKDSVSQNADRQGEVADTRKERNRKERNRKEKYTKSQIFLTDLLIEKIKENDPKAKTPEKNTNQYFKWIDSIRLCLDRDERTVDEITRGIMYAQTSDFWKSNILSAAKLRKQMPTLLLQAQREKYDYSQVRVGQSTKKTTPEQEEYYKARREKEAEIRAKYKKEISDIRKAGDIKEWNILQEKIAEEVREWSMNYRESKGGQG